MTLLVTPEQAAKLDLGEQSGHASSHAPKSRRRRRGSLDPPGHHRRAQPESSRASGRNAEARPAACSRSTAAQAREFRPKRSERSGETRKEW